MLKLREDTKIYVATRPVDFRKAINGLSCLVAEEFNHQTSDGAVYVFYNRARDKIKCLFWDKNGFVLYHKRLEVGRFKIKTQEEALDSISSQALEWLLAGLEYNLMEQFNELSFENYF